VSSQRSPDHAFDRFVNVSTPLRVRVYCVDAAHSTTLQLADSRWIGCWWLGYLLVSAAILLTAIPLWFFPASMSQHRRRRSADDNATSSRDQQVSPAVSGVAAWRQIKGCKLPFVSVVDSFDEVQVYFRPTLVPVTMD